MDTPQPTQKSEETKGVGAWLDRLGLIWLLPLGLLMMLAPWPGEATPHLVEKLEMLSAGTLTQAMDIFDLFMHGTPITLALAKVLRLVQLRLRS